MPGSGATRSAWMDGVSLIPRDGPLTGDAQADVCIVGAGIAGLTTAYLLAKEGRSVIVLDDGAPGMGETLRTTAHLTAAIDDRIFVLERKLGARKARLAVESQLAAIDRIERVCLDERLDGVFRRVDGHLFLHPDEPTETLDKELEAAQRCGLPDVRRLDRTPLPFQAGPCLLFPRQGQVDAGHYLAGLADAIRRMGGRIHGGTHAEEIAEGPPATVTTSRGRVECEAIVVCTDSPVFGKVAFHTKQDQYRTYVVAYEVPRGAVPHALFWDTSAEGRGYHYIRLAERAEPGSELLLVGGEDHRVGDGDPEDSFQRLEDWCALRFGVHSPTYRWSGQVIEPADHLPFLGRYPGKGKNVYVITGDSGQGFTNHTCGAMLVTDLIQGRRNPWQGLYSPSRQGLGSLLRRLRGNAEGAAAAVRGKTEERPAVTDEHDLPPGSGAVLERNGEAVACYREPSGDLRECAAACTHMGATVEWNDVEKTWDCPWHGSRFSALGHVLNGPANQPLDAPADPDTSHSPPSRRKRQARGRRSGKANRKPARRAETPADETRQRHP